MAKISVGLVFNPAAGMGRSRAAAERVREALEQAGGEVESFSTRGPGDGAEQGRLAAESHPVVAVYGGDGSVNEALNGVVKSGRPAKVLLLAGGTMNVLVRDLKIPLNPLRAARLLSTGAPRRIYLGHAEGRGYFTLMASAGYDASIICHMAERTRLKKAIGPFAFAWEGFRHLGFYRPPEIVVEADGKEYRGYNVVVGKSHGYGGFFSVTSQADVTKPEFQVAVFKRPTMWRNFAYLGLAIASRLDLSPDHVFFHATKVSVRSPVDVPIQMDGDPAGKLPAEFHIDGASVEVLA